MSVPHCCSVSLMTRSGAAVMSFPRYFFFIFFFFASLAIAQVNSVQQRDTMDDPRRLQSYTSYDTAPGTAILIFKVYSERDGSHLDRQALLKLVDQTTRSASWRTTEDNSLGVFTDVAYGHYDVEVSAVGYRS